MSSEVKKMFEQRVKLQSSTNLLEVKLSGRGLGDEQMVDLGRYLDSILPSPDPDMTEEAIWTNVELAENNIGNAGLISVLDALHRHRVACKSLKLYRNKICDEGCIRLAELVRRQQSAVDEIHLSHNMFSARSLVALCMALAKHDGYPALGRNRLYIPCWVRMEYNCIAKPLEVLEMLRRDGPISICTAENRDDCGPWRCACSNKDKNSVPKVHLFTIANQSRRITPHEDSQLRESIRKWGGEPQPIGPGVRRASPTVPTGPKPMLPKPGMNCTTPTANVANAPPRSPVWDTSGALRRTVSMPVPGTNHKDEGGKSEQNREQQSPEDKIINGTKEQSPPAKSEPTFCIPETEVSSPREASGPDSFDPPPRTSPATDDGDSKAEAAAAGALLKRLQGSSNGSTETSGDTKTEIASSHRKSLVLDGSNRRRIDCRQLVEADNSGPFICPLCGFVIARPVITSCSHLFCEACFRGWVSEQVSKQKKGQSPQAAVPLIPCPLSVNSACSGKLRKQDIMLLDKADSTKVAAVGLLQRLRNNLRVRCVHHVDNFKLPFGADANRLANESGMKCTWVGDLMAYDEHIAKGCEVENRLAAKCCVNGKAAGPAKSSPSTTQPASATDARESEAVTSQKQASAPCRTNGSSNHITTDEEVQKLAAEHNASSNGDGEVRVAQYDYVPRDTDKAQIPLKRHDLVRVFEITDSGWAAGVRLSRETMQEVGEAGWFPEGYLFPLNGDKKE